MNQFVWVMIALLCTLLIDDIFAKPTTSKKKCTLTEGSKQKRKNDCASIKSCLDYISSQSKEMVGKFENHPQLQGTQCEIVKTTEETPKPIHFAVNLAKLQKTYNYIVNDQDQTEFSSRLRDRIQGHYDDGQKTLHSLNQRLDSDSIVCNSDVEARSSYFKVNHKNCVKKHLKDIYKELKKIAKYLSEYYSS